MTGISDSIIGDLATLETVIGKTPPAVHLKVIDHLDATALHWLSQSPLAAIGIAGAGRIDTMLAGGERGFASGDQNILRLPIGALDQPGLLRAGTSIGTLFLAAGIGETLRINGRVESLTDSEIIVAVRECYAHCAKALIRSDFWSADPAVAVPDDPAAFVAASRFMALASCNADGDADLSPKGDPAGAMARLIDGDLWFADRPGNRRVDSFRNILERPEIGAALLIPGASRIAVLRGKATLTTDSAVRDAFTVRDRVPALAIRVDPAEITLLDSPALARAGLWPLTENADGIDPAGMFVAHVKLNKHKGIVARIASAAMSPGLLRKGLAADYRKKLY